MTPDALVFTASGVTVEVKGVLGELARLVLLAGAGMVDRAPTSPQVRLEVATAPDGLLLLNGQALSQDPSLAAAAVLAAVDRAALRLTAGVCVHAAAVSGPLGAAVLPGVSGAGKSTLAGACLCAGLALVSDEAACVRADDLLLHPHSRPLGLSAASRALLGLGAGPHDGGTELATSPHLLGRSVPVGDLVPVALIAILDRQPGASAELRAASRTEALASLLANRLDVGDQPRWTPEEAWQVLARLTAQTPVARLTFDSPLEAARLLRSALGGGLADHVLEEPMRGEVSTDGV